jgi:hypothetical protein
MRLSAVLVFVLLSASTVYAGDPPPLAAGASEAQVLESLEQARVALGAKKYEDAGKLVEQVLKQPVFAEMSSEIQAHGLRIAGYAAMGRRDPLAAHEFFSLLTEFKGRTPTTGHSVCTPRCTSNRFPMPRPRSRRS